MQRDDSTAHYGDDSILGDEVSQMIRNLHNRMVQG
jgi:hypothetical protein